MFNIKKSNIKDFLIISLFVIIKVIWLKYESGERFKTIKMVLKSKLEKPKKKRKS